MLDQHAHAPRLELNAVRIAGTSAAIALHAVALMLLLAPTQWTPPPKVVEKPDERFFEYKPLPIHVRPIAIPTPVTPIARQADPRPQTHPTQSHDPVATTDTPSSIAGAETGETIEPIGDPPPPTLAQLTANIAPAPPYPALALRAGTTGTVILRINVDSLGRPVDGSIEKSSGSRLLDQAALKFVLARWHFNPAMRGSTPIDAIALVPIEFSLDQ